MSIVLEPGQLVAFAVASAVLVGMPGPNIVYIVTRSLAHGVRAGVVSVLGVETGTAVYAAATALGLSALIAATDDTERSTGLSLDAATSLEPYFEAVRLLYGPFESGLPGPTGRVYAHEIPGGQLSNLRQQAIALGLGDRFEAIEDMYAAANAMLGNIVKVTPSSKVVGDLALHLVAVGADPVEFAEDPGRFDIPDSVVGFLRVAANEAVVQFDGQGAASVNQIVKFLGPAADTCYPQGPRRCLHVVISLGGQVRLCDPGISNNGDNRKC